MVILQKSLCKWRTI